jgi:hypothetical protein
VWKSGSKVSTMERHFPKAIRGVIAAVKATIQPQTSAADDADNQKINQRVRR